MRWFGPILCCLALGCASVSHSSRPSMSGCGDEICATARVLGNQIDVALQVPSLGRKSIRLDFVEGVLGRDFTAHYVRLVDNAGNEHPWPGLFDVRGAKLAVHYRVRLPKTHPDRRRDRSFKHPAGVHLKGYSFLPDFDGGPSQLRFEKPEEEVLLGSPRGTSAGFDGPRYRDLVRATYELGKIPHRCAKVESIPVCVASSRASPDELDAMLVLVRDTLRSATRMLGPIERPAVLVSDHAIDGPTPFGSAIGTGITIVSSRPSQADPLAKSSFALVHELIHLWNPGPRRAPDLWLREGLTEYFAYATIADMTGSGDVPLTAWIERAYRRYQAARDNSIEHTSDELVYPAGAVAGFCLDHDLRKSGSSVAEVMRSILARIPEDEDAVISQDFFLAEVARVSPSSAGYFKLLLSEQGFNFSVCMLRALRGVTNRNLHGAAGYSP